MDTCKSSNIIFSIGVWRDRMWPDGWTAVTADGKRSAQFEHTLLVSPFLLSPITVVWLFSSLFPAHLNRVLMKVINI